MKKLLGLNLAFIAIKTNLYAAEAGMPQLDPKYWASQSFWLILVFTILYFTISKFFLPKIKRNLDDRENKIKDDLDEAKNFQELAEKKQKEYDQVITAAKKEVIKITLDSKSKLDNDIKNKKETAEKEIHFEIKKAEKEIIGLKNSSIKDIEKISLDITSNIIEEISGDKLNESSIKAVVADTLKKNMEKNI